MATNMQEHKKNPVEDPRLVLWSERGSDGKSSSCRIQCFNNAPRFKIYPSNQDKKPLTMKIDIMMFSEIMTEAERIFKNPNPSQQRFALEGFIAQGKKGVVGTMIVGKDQEGTAYFGFITHGWKEPERFNFRPYYQLKRVDREGNEIPANEISSTIGLAWIKVAQEMVFRSFHQEWTEPEPRNNNNNNRNNNYGNNNNYSNNNNSGGNSNYSSSSSSDDDWDDLM